MLNVVDLRFCKKGMGRYEWIVGTLTLMIIIGILSVADYELKGWIK